MTGKRQILFDDRHAGEARVSNFRLVSSDIPPLREGQVLVRNNCLGLDSQMCGRMKMRKAAPARTYRDRSCSAPETFPGMPNGRNFGKRLVRPISSMGKPICSPIADADDHSA
jgi:NADPH-dependent curcumin reductase CurA